MIQKVFATSSGKAVFTCPECGKARHMDVSKYKDVEKAVKLKYTCPCSHKFSVLLERRQHVRKKVNLKGTLIVDHKKYPVELIDISRRGIRGRSNDRIPVSPGQSVRLEFTLDDSNSSTVSKDMQVRSVVLPHIGMEFSSTDHYDKLGPYLLFHLG